MARRDCIKTTSGCRVTIDEFRQRLAAAYDDWNSTGGQSPAAFFALMDEAIVFRTVLETAFPHDPLSGPFMGKRSVIAYWTAIAESWQMISSRADRLVAEGDTLVWHGEVRWRHRRTLRELATPKVDVWTVFQGRAIRFFEMIDSMAYARAIGETVPAT